MRLRGGAFDPTGFSAISQYAYLRLFQILRDRGVEWVDVGGSETEDLNRFKRQLGAGAVPSHWVVAVPELHAVASVTVDALTESHRLVWGNWWRTAAILTVGFIIIFVIYLIAGVIIGVLTPIFVLGGGGGAENVLLITLIGGLLVGVLTSLLMTPFYIGLAIAIYWDLKLRKDGGDLAARVGALNPA